MLSHIALRLLRISSPVRLASMESLTGLLSHITLRHLKWLVTFTPPVTVITFEYIRHSASWASLLPVWGGNLIEAGLLLLGTVVLLQGMFRLIEGMVQENERRRREAEALFKVSMEITASLESERLLQYIVDHARSLLSADVATLALTEDGCDSEPPALKAASGMTLAELEQIRAHMNRQLLVEKAVQTGKPSLEEYAPGELCEIHCRLAVPLWSAERVIGALCVATKEPRRFSKDDLTVLEQLAVQASIVIEKSRLQARAQHVVLLEERERISRELHDGLGQTLSYLALKLEVISEHMEVQQLELAKAELELLHKVTRDAALDVRESILGLRTNVTPGACRVTVLEHYLTQYRELTGISVDFIAGDGAHIELPTKAEVQLMRILQETLTNVRKHADATQVRVQLEGDDCCLRVSVQDNGRGFNVGCTPTGSHFGLAMMRERAKTFGGKLEVDSMPGRGTHVNLTIPLN